jgi:uncharacterized protein involved in cysteine biosynthesis
MKDARRPGTALRLAAGAWHVPAGIAFLVRRPRLWPLCALPALTAAVLLLIGLVAGLVGVPAVDDLVNPSRESRGWLGTLMTAALWIGTPLAGALIGLALALVLTAPILERLSRAVETLLAGEAVDGSPGLRWEMAQSVKSALYFLVRTPVMFLVGLLPIVGPPIAVLWGAHALAFQQTESPLTRQGFDFLARRAWHERHRAEALGFGLGGLLALVVPFANLLLAPALTAGAARLVLELLDREAQIEEEEAQAPSAAPERENAEGTGGRD